MNRQIKTSITTSSRSAFTLLELLAVIVIISILLALILPAISGVLRRADVVAVRADLSQAEQALTTFKETFGEYPPSSLIIPDDENNWDAKSRAAVRKFWPQFNFTSLGGLAGGYPANPIHLNGAECLVFFLGGVDGDADPSNGYSPGGFSKNALLPWAPISSTNTSQPTSQNRLGPFLEFDAGRLTSTGPITAVYVDSMADQSTPIMYLSGSGRNMPRANTPGPDAFDVFETDFTDTTTNPKDLQFAYTQADGKTLLKKDSFQLISPGADGAYGVGGVYASDDDLPGNRTAERDNITNFANGTLN